MMQQNIIQNHLIRVRIVNKKQQLERDDVKNQECERVCSQKPKITKSDEQFEFHRVHNL